MTGTPRRPSPARSCGRDFTPAELGLIRDLAATLPTRRAIAEAVCDALGWHAPDGRRKDMTARVALGRMAADQLITLPPPRNGNGNGRHARHATGAGQLTLPLPPHPAATLADLGPVTVTVVGSRQASRQWNQLIREHHYLGYTPLAGAQIRYLATAPAAGQIAALGFAASAWKCAPHDTWIGWDPATRAANLNLICGNARFLIRPDITAPNLASWLLAAITRRLPGDWQTRYGYAPVLTETFVETPRFTGASYRAANWIRVGHTQGRGKLDRRHQHALPVKDIYLYPCTGTGSRSSPRRPPSDTPRDHRILTIGEPTSEPGRQKLLRAPSSAATPRRSGNSGTPHPLRHAPRAACKNVTIGRPAVGYSRARRLVSRPPEAPQRRESPTRNGHRDPASRHAHHQALPSSGPHPAAARCAPP